MNEIIKITQKEVPISFFDEPSLQSQINKIFDSLNTQIEDKIGYFIYFIINSAPYEIVYYPISPEKVYNLFKFYFLRKTLDKAISISLTEKGKYNIVSNSIELLNESNLQKEIEGNCMIDAILEIANNIFWKPDFEPHIREEMGNLIINEFYKNKT